MRVEKGFICSMGNVWSKVSHLSTFLKEIDLVDNFDSLSPSKINYDICDSDWIVGLYEQNEYIIYHYYFLGTGH